MKIGERNYLDSDDKNEKAGLIAKVNKTLEENSNIEDKSPPETPDKDIVETFEDFVTRSDDKVDHFPDDEYDQEINIDI